MLIDLKKNIIEMDQCFWDLNVNFQGRHIISTYGHYMQMGSHDLVSNDKLIKNIQYNNMWKKKLCNDNLKKLIICYGCNKPRHI